MGSIYDVRKALPSFLLVVIAYAQFAALAAQPVGAVNSTALPIVGTTAPALEAIDGTGKPWRLSAERGHPVAVFFYCGCDACRRCAKEWGTVQRSGLLTAAPFRTAALPVTIIVNTTDAAGIKQFAQRTGLASCRTVLVPDPSEKLTNVYAVAPCPRVFVIDATGVLRYTNNSSDDAPQQDTEQIIARRTLAALREAARSTDNKTIR